MTDPSMSIAYTGRINGTWDPGTVPPLEDWDYVTAQSAVSASIAPMLDLVTPLNEFQVISSVANVDEVLRTRWRVEALAGGPTLIPGIDEPHPASVYFMFRLYPLTQLKQLQIDVDAPDWPYRGMLSGSIPALLLRQAWGTDPRQINVASFGTGSFTPTSLSYMSYDGYTNRTFPYVQSDVADMSIACAPQGYNQQSIWLVTTTGGDEPAPFVQKLSYMVAPGLPLTVENRWDDPAEPPPPFVDLPWTDDLVED